MYRDSNEAAFHRVAGLEHENAGLKHENFELAVQNERLQRELATNREVKESEALRLFMKKRFFPVAMVLGLGALAAGAYQAALSPEPSYITSDAGVPDPTAPAPYITASIHPPENWPDIVLVPPHELGESLPLPPLCSSSNSTETIVYGCRHDTQMESVFGTRIHVHKTFTVPPWEHTYLDSILAPPTSIGPMPSGY